MYHWYIVERDIPNGAQDMPLWVIGWSDPPLGLDESDSGSDDVVSLPSEEDD